MPESAMKSRAALVEDVGDVLEVLGRLLDADDVRVRAPQAADGRRRDVDGGADRHVVDEQRQVGNSLATREYQSYSPCCCGRP